MQTRMPWTERALVVSAFLTLLLLAYGETRSRGTMTIEAFDRENRALELEFLKLEREALNDDSIAWGERVEAWTEGNQERFETLLAAQEELDIPEEEAIVSEVDPADITNPVERAMVEAHQRLDQALRRDMAEQFMEGDDYAAWVEDWSKRNQGLLEEAERTAKRHLEEQWEKIEPIVIEEIDDSEEAIKIADAQERMAEKILELRVLHRAFDSFQSALDGHSEFFEEYQTIIEVESKIIEARNLDALIKELETHP